MDDLTYSYGTGNKLKQVADIGNKIYGFKDNDNAGDDYAYDANKGINQIKYNHLNLPIEVTIDDGENAGTISYIYDAAGVKLQKVVNKTGAESSLTTTDYAGNYIYKNNVLEFFSNPEGYTKPIIENEAISSYEYVYQYKDHLGNVCLSYTDKDDELEIVEENNYYPFGLKHKGYNEIVRSSNLAQKLKYNGIEYEQGLGINLYEMDVRSYDPAIARFNGIDPITHFSQGTSVAFDNNPIYYTDPRSR